MHSSNLIDQHRSQGRVVFLQDALCNLSPAFLDKNDKNIGEFVDHFPELGLSKDEIMKGEFLRLAPKSKRPSGGCKRKD